MTRGRCTRHGLAIGPDGGCVLCRREESSAVPGDAGGIPSAPPRLGADETAQAPVSSPSSSARMSWTTPAAPVVSPASGPITDQKSEPPASQRPPSIRPRSSVPPPKQPIVSIFPGDDGDEVVVRLPRWLIAAAVALVVAGGAFAWSRVTPDMSFFSRLIPEPPAEAPLQPAAPESPAPSARATEEAAPQTAEPRRAPATETHVPVPGANQNDDPAAVARRLQNQIEEKKEQLALARRNVSVTMYSTSWCRACKEARKYFSEAGITYDEYDVDVDRDADKRLRAVNPRHTVPTIDIDGAVLTGFSPGAFESMLTSAAARRAARE